MSCEEQLFRRFVTGTSCVSATGCIQDHAWIRAHSTLRSPRCMSAVFIARTFSLNLLNCFYCLWQDAHSKWHWDRRGPAIASFPWRVACQSADWGSCRFQMGGGIAAERGLKMVDVCKTHLTLDFSGE